MTDRAMPRGYKTDRGRIKLAISFTPEMFDHIKQMAKRNDHSFAAEVETILKAGIFDLNESDRLEPDYSPLDGHRSDR